MPNRIAQEEVDAMIATLLPEEVGAMIATLLPEKERHIFLREVVEQGARSEIRRQRKNAHAREKYAWRKTVSREETALRWRGQPIPCTVASYLAAEQQLLGWLSSHPDEKIEDAAQALLLLARLVLQQLHPEEEGNDFRIDDIHSTAMEIAFNYTLHPALGIKSSVVDMALIDLGIKALKRNRKRFNTLLGDLVIDL